MVEVGLVLPIFILTIVAVLEFGYFAALASAVSTASREGARFGSTVQDSGGGPNYLNCAEIEAHAQELAGPLIDITDIQIGYDTDGDPAAEVPCSPSVDEDDIDRWDRVVVEVTYDWSPMTPLMGNIIGDRELTSIDRRSIVKCESC
jgi:Flp pilus assembly protein TadG